MLSHWPPVLTLANWLRPFLLGLDATVHDWCLTIILFTLLIRLLLFPVTIRQARFAWKNHLFSRAFRELTKLYKHDPDLLQEKTKKLSMEQKYNPFGMILTAVLQMPIFAAIYAIFDHFGTNITTVLIPWAPHLAKPDPLHLLPILVAGLCAAGTWVPMIEPDPQQPYRKAGRMLPMFVVFPAMLFVLWKAPLAIALYIAVSTSWGMVERTFLKTPYAVEKFRIRKEPIASVSAGVVVAKPEIRKA